MGKLYRDLVRAHSKAKGSARALLNILADYADDNGEAWPTRATLANDTGMSERNVTRCLQALCEQGRLRLEENATGGRGRVPIYRIVFPESEKGDTVSPFNEEKRVTNARKKGDNLSLKGDKCVSIPSHARREPQEPKEEPQGERAPARVLHSRNANGSAASTIAFKSPHVDNSHFDLDTGYIAAGKGETAVEVYYERFDVAHKDARLNAIKEDDLMLHCKDLAKLREVVTAYSRTSFQLGNVQLILDWYTKGIPDKHKPPGVNGVNGTHKNGALSEAEKSAILTRAKTARGNIRTAQQFKGVVDPQWERDIEKARELGLPV